MQGHASMLLNNQAALGLVYTFIHVHAVTQTTCTQHSVCILSMKYTRQVHMYVATVALLEGDPRYDMM